MKMSINEIDGAFSKEELLYVYRKVKRNLYFEKDSILLEKIVVFENNLEENINFLYNLLKSNDSNFDQIISQIDVGSFTYLHKNINFGKDEKQKIISTKTVENYQKKLFKIDNVECRFIGDISIIFQLIGGLWINRIGYKIDETLSNDVYGCRLENFDSNINVKNYKQNNTLFKPYFQDFKSWQNNLFKKIEQSDKDIIVLTSDLTKYYHSIDINFLENKVEESFSDVNSYNSNFDIFLNKLVFALIRKCNKKNNFHYSYYTNVEDIKNRGLPLTLNVSKVLANFHLKEFDEDIVKNVKPLYYGRYVDDFIIAVEKTSNLHIDLRSILRGLKYHTIDGENKILCSKFIKNGEKISLGIFNPDKEKIFSFNYEKDKGEIDHLKKAINKNSSEWKLIPDISEYDEINSSDFFNDTNKDCEEVDSLRKSTGLSIKRNHFVRQILAFENNINSLDKFYWEDRLDKFLNLIFEYVFDLKNFIDLSKFIPRLFGIVIHSKSTEIQLQFFQKFEEVLIFLSTISKSNELDIANRYLQKKTVECIICSLPLDFEAGDSSITSFLSNFLNKHFFDESDLDNSILDYFNADLHRIPYKDCYFKYDEYVKYLNSNIENLHEEIIEYKFFKLKTLEFIAANLESTQCGCEHEHCEIECRLITQSSGFFFFTRRISLLELTIAFKNKVLTNYEDFRSLAESYYYKVNLNIDVSKDKFFIDFDKKNFLKDNVKNPMIANTHFMTHESSFDANVRNITDLDVERPDKLKQIVNDVINCKNKVDYLVFHELALPRNLYVQLASKLSFAGINLVAGLEYKINRDTLSADNQLVYILKNLNGTENQSIAVFQSKLVGAVEETVIIRNKANLKIIPQFTAKLIIKHSGFVFSGLICNDLLYIKNRSDLAGDIDNLFIVTWNKDIETYENLVKSTCLDLHSFITLCNNREYGDSRIRGPYKDSWRRDLMKIHGGMLDTFVLSELDIKALRNFQTNEMPPKDPFKPFSIGFKISNERRLI